MLAFYVFIWYNIHMNEMGDHSSFLESSLYGDRLPDTEFTLEPELSLEFEDTTLAPLDTTYDNLEIDKGAEANTTENDLSNGPIGRLKGLGRFALSRSTAWVEWGAGIAVGNSMVGAGVSRTVASLAVVAGVYKLESAQVTKLREKEAPIDVVPKIEYEATASKETSRIKRATKRIGKDIVKSAKFIGRETGALLSASWQGAPATMNHNRAFGIENTKRRGKVQSLLYGIAVGYWVSPLPGANDIREGAKDVGVETINYAVNNPVEAGLGSMAFTTGLFYFYQLLENRKSKKS